VDCSGPGIRRVRRGRGFSYVDEHGGRLADSSTLERIRALAIPPAWEDVWIARNPAAKLQATGVDAAGRRQYLYHPAFRAAREREKFERLIRFGQRLPELRRALAAHMALPATERDRVCALATRLINETWFRVGDERYARSARTYGVTTLRKRHVTVERGGLRFCFRAKHGQLVRLTLADRSLRTAVGELLGLPGGSRLFRYENGNGLTPLTGAVLNTYLREHLGDEFSAKDFRTWGGTLAVAVALAEHGPPESEAQERRAVAEAVRVAAEALGNTPAVVRGSYVSPAVLEQFREGRTLAHFRPRHLRVVAARSTRLTAEERALLALLRSWRARTSRRAA
jgi:DNA topoisomerase IB